ncbi:MAG: phosphate transport system regulatory protein PhoU [Thermoplasmata archaeon M11B2D]|nr:MAG: phosphate transport system regulatory protein PhoU [Thermoplasmata archaeon M11B2D]PNX49811.1 MAG: phosphate transport system regulatory protein PhoU [Thermoplasmata archaeon M9B2D]
MVEKFHVELNQAKKEIDTMGHLAKDMLSKSVEALKDIDTQKAQWVISNKVQLADMDDQIEEKALRLIALYQPMARDLREIACILKMITYLNRIGRYGKDIAKLVSEFEKNGHVKKLVSLPHMADLVTGMINDALYAFETGDISKFKDFIDRETTVDELRYSIFRECLSYMMEDPSVITRCTYYIIIARYLERCGDHACKMAEKIVYMVTGERVEIDYREETSKTSFTGIK